MYLKEVCLESVSSQQDSGSEVSGLSQHVVAEPFWLNGGTERATAATLARFLSGWPPPHRPCRRCWGDAEDLEVATACMVPAEVGVARSPAAFGEACHASSAVGNIQDARIGVCRAGRLRARYFDRVECRSAVTEGHVAGTWRRLFHQHQGVAAVLRVRSPRGREGLPARFTSADGGVARSKHRGNPAVEVPIARPSVTLPPPFRDSRCPKPKAPPPTTSPRGHPCSDRTGCMMWRITPSRMAGM